MISPDYGTALFSLDGGASQCTWEVGTAHRVQPTILGEYIGPPTLKPDDAALFKVTVGNNLNYYGAGPAAGKFRPGWAAGDGGYYAAEFRLSVDLQSLPGGLSAGGNLGSYADFGKGKIDVLVTVSRGPRDYTYPPVSIAWRQHCPLTFRDDLRIGENTDTQLRMPNKDGAITFTPACPAIEWSGQLLERQFFSATCSAEGIGDHLCTAHARGVDAAVVVSGARDRPVKRVALEWRVVLGAGFKSTWHGLNTGEAFLLTSNGKTLYSGKWNVPLTFEDGTYEVRAVVECTDLPSSDPHDFRVLPAIRGVVDFTAPELISVTTSSLSATFAKGDYMLLLFSEDVVCSGWMVDGKSKAAVDATVNFGKQKSFIIGKLPGNLDYSCEGPQMKVAIPAFDAAAAKEVAGLPISVELFGGIYDLAGNSMMKGSKTTVLSAGRASEERGINAAKIDASRADLSVRIGATNMSVLSAVSGVESSLESSLNALNQSNHAANRETKASIASLATMLASLLRASGAATPAFPVCKDRPAMYSFARYVRGRVPPAAATSAAAATAAVCASKCLEVATCTAFSFGRFDGCILATGAPSSELSEDRTSQFRVRLEKCSGV